MAERQKVRLVRCPKCENVLREQSDFSVYRCGSCGTFLQAKKNISVNEGPLKKIDNEKNEESFEKLKISSQREHGDYLGTKSPNGKEINGYFPNNRKDGVFKHKNHNLLGYNDNYRQPLKQQIGSSVGLNDDQFKSKGILDYNRMANNRTKSSGFGYPIDNANPKRFAHLEHDRAELLRKLDELKEQINRNGSVNHVQRRAEFEHYSKVMEMKKSYSNGEYIGFNRAQLASYSRSSLYHRPNCSCIECYNTSQHDPSKIKHFVSSNRRSLYHRQRDANSGSRWPCYNIDTNFGMFQNPQLCHPMAGGSPFIVCNSCFRVLKLPRKFISREKNRHKLQCGACSTVLSLETKNKKRIISISVEKAKRNVSLKDEDNDSQDSIVVQSDFSHVSEPLTKNNHNSPCLEENRIENAYQENSAKNLSSECELEVSRKECPTSHLSRDSMEASKGKVEEIDPLKTSSRDFSISNNPTEYEKPAVSINGQRIPDHIVKKVEKLAGTIQPGDYWYDFQAGFWGVMGHPCLGIIPPFIKEFNYPIARNCAAGNTKIFVNGRELNHRDLDLLSSRGLPTIKDKFYVVEISGRVFDSDSGMKICSLGKLAPTVEKLKRGFGMKVPRSCEK